MKKLIVLAMVAMIATIGGGLFGPSESARAAGPTCAVPGDYTTIQAAVNASNCTTINVASGTYAGNINVTRSVTIIGDPGDASPGPGAGAPIIDGGSAVGSAFFIANGVSNVTISGFEMQNFINGPGAGEGNGISAWEASTSNITIRDNYFHHLGWNGVLVGNDDALGDHTNWTIEDNILETFEAYGFELTNTSYSSIEGNIIHLDTASAPDTAIMVGARRNEAGITIKNNRIDGGITTSRLATIYVFAVDIETNAVNLSNVVIEGNAITTTGPKPHVRIYSYPSTVWGSGTGTITTVSANRNSFLTFFSNTPATVDGTCNWWGSASGPSVGQYSGAVTVAPWLATSDLDGPCRGGLVITKNQCKNGGWATFFPAALFKNQGDCVSFTNTGK